MAISVKDLEAALPNHYIVGGEAIVFHETKHVVLGKYVGDDLVILSKDGEALLASLDSAPAEAPTEAKPRSPRAKKAAPAAAPVVAVEEATGAEGEPGIDDLDLDD